MSEVKSRLSEIADEVARTHDRVCVTRNGRDYVVLMAQADLESMKATLELLSDPEEMALVAEAQADIAAARFTTMQDMKALMQARRLREEA